MQSIKMESKTYQYRKVTKPLLERKRRARINKCLDNLKDLMIDSMRQQGDNIARLEKADILELTVEHLKKIKTTPSIEPSTLTNNNIDSFRSGYVHAANEVSRALASFSRVDIELGTKLMTHLGHRLNQLQHQHQDIVIKKCNSNDIISSSKGISPLSVYCDNTGYNYNHSQTMIISPSLSSGYGSESEFSLSSSSLTSSPNQFDANVWRPW